MCVGRPARRRAEGGHDGGWMLRVAAVANCEASSSRRGRLRSSRRGRFWSCGRRGRLRSSRTLNLKP
jgi:hypothetical protein